MLAFRVQASLPYNNLNTGHYWPHIGMANLGQELDIKFTAALIIFLNDARAIQSGQVTYIQVSVI